MASTVEDLLGQAIQRLKEGKRGHAYNLFTVILHKDPQNVRALWGMANSAPTPEKARAILQRLLKVEPDHQKAQHLLALIDLRYPSGAAQPVPEPDFFRQIEAETMRSELPEPIEPPVSKPTLAPTQPTDPHPPSM